MTIIQLKYFVEVVEQGSVSLASKKLYVTQPTISMAIANLEKEYNIKLFDRSQNVLVMTPYGEFFYAKAKMILELVDSLDKDLIDLALKQQTIKIGVPPMIGSFLFPKIYQAYKKEFSGADFEISEEGSINIRNKIVSRNLDLAFAILNDFNEDFHKETLLTTRLLFCVSKDHPLAKLDKVTINDIKDKNILLMKEGSYQNHLVNQIFDRAQIKPKISLVSSQVSVIYEFIKFGAGGAFLIEELVDMLGDSIVGIPLSEDLKLDIGLIWHKDIVLQKSALDFLNYLRRYKKYL